MDPHQNWPLGTVCTHESWHFLRRLFERYKIVLRPGEYSLIKKALEHETVPLVEKNRKHNSYIYKVRTKRGVKTAQIYIAYNRTRKMIMTALPAGRFAQPTRKRNRKKKDRQLRWN